MNFEIPLLKVSLIALAAVAFSTAHADIYKCTDEHGNVAYLQLPCPAEEPKAANKTDEAELRAAEPEQREDVEAPTKESQIIAPQTPSSRRPGERLDACKKRYRDQIDEIDAEIRKSYTPAKDALFKTRLLALTRQLRACG